MFTAFCRRLVGVLVVAIAALSIVPLASAAVPTATNAGAVHFVKVTSSSFDQWTDRPTATVSLNGQQSTFANWMNAKFWRSTVFGGYFDNKTSWYDKGWLYIDSYAIYNGTATAAAQSDWILRDAQGNKLFIPWGCGNGTCPQYAADIGNPDYRAWFVGYVRGMVAKGYRGLWLDDVNLDFRVGNGQGQSVAPMDSRTGRPMTEDAWRGYFATLVTQVRAALPGIEMVHNSIWYAGGAQRDANPDVQREIAATDVINLERGVNDDGLTGGNGQWSLNAYLGFVDRLHQLGKSVVFDSYDSGTQAREYNLGAYFLTSQGSDGVGLNSITPSNWWSMYDVDLGSACGARQSLGNGLLRRDFTGGQVFLGDPSATTRTIALDRPMKDENGTTVTSITVGAKSAVILRGATSCTPDPSIPTSVVTPGSGTTVPPPAATPTPAPAPSSGGGRTATVPTTPSTPTTRPAAGHTTTRSTRHPRLKITRITTRPAASAKARASRVSSTSTRDVVVTGEAAGLGVSKLRATVYRRVGGRWSRNAAATVKLGTSDGWALAINGTARGSYRIEVRADKASTAARFTVAG